MYKKTVSEIPLERTATAQRESTFIYENGNPGHTMRLEGGKYAYDSTYKKG